VRLERQPGPRRENCTDGEYSPVDGSAGELFDIPSGSDRTGILILAEPARLIGRVPVVYVSASNHLRNHRTTPHGNQAKNKAADCIKSGH